METTPLQKIKNYLTQHVSQHVKLGAGVGLPDLAWGTVVMEHSDGREARVAWINLPSFCMVEHMLHGEPRWAQRVLQYHGWYGFRIGHRFLEDGWTQ